MQNNGNTLTSYLILLKNHISETAKFNYLTNNFLSSPTIADLFFEDMGRVFFEEILGDVTFSTSQKVLFLIKEIADQSKSYLERFISYAKALEELIKFIGNTKNS